MVSEVDLLILGGGCAGLSLAWRLCELGTACPNTLVVEQRTAYDNDRTWCFWDDSGARVDSLVSHEWQWLELKSGERAVHFDCGAMSYQMLAASDFYAFARNVIHETTEVRLSLGTAVTAEPRKVSAGWSVETDQGTVIAKMVVDTRPGHAPEKGKAVLWQSFYGQEVVCDFETFDPQRALLMEFTATTSRQIPFTYILPTSRHRALIEATVFGPDPVRSTDLLEQFEAAKLRCIGTNPSSMVRSESGILPMGLNKQPVSLGQGHIQVGVMAGAARPSSGFAFQRIQHWAEQCCLEIAQGRGPVGHAKDPLMMRMMDRLFLKVIASNPQTAPDLFLSIFEKADSASVIRFLSGKGTSKDYFQIMTALPAQHFVRQLLGMTSLPSLRRSAP